MFVLPFGGEGGRGKGKGGNVHTPKGGLRAATWTVKTRYGYIETWHLTIDYRGGVRPITLGLGP